MTQQIRVPWPLAHLMIESLTCDIGCCYLDAFDVSPEAIQRWQQKESGNDLKECFEQLNQLIALSSKYSDEGVEVSLGINIFSADKEGNQIVTERFDNIGGTDWCNFLEEWKEQILKVIAL